MLFRPRLGFPGARPAGPRSLKTSIFYAVLGTGVFNACRYAPIILMAKLAGDAATLGQYTYCMALISPIVLFFTMGARSALIADAAERTGSMTLAGSENLTAQAVFYACTEEPLIGEELYAAGAYLQAGAIHNASLMTQDIFRWLLIVAILAGAAARLVGVW